jgi:tetratricopeptide (TPR) repeat protein
MSIDLNNPLNEGITQLKKWRDRYSNKEYPSKIILNIFYRQYIMDSIWEIQIINSFDKLANSEIEIIESFKKIENQYSINAQKFNSGNRLINLMKESVEIGGLNYNSLLPLIEKAENEDNKAIEELEFTYLFWLLANKTSIMWSSFGRIGLTKFESVTKITGKIIKINESFTYKNTLAIFGNLIVSKFLETTYTPLKPIFMNNHEEEFLSGIEAYNNANYENAIYFLEKSILSIESAGFDNNTKKDITEISYYNLGNSKKEVDDFTGAIEYYKKALDSNPSRPEFEKIFLFLQECCFKINTKESLKIAVEYLNICTKYYPENVNAFMNKGIAYYNLKDNTNAKTAFKIAKRLGNQDAQQFIDHC